MFCCSYSYSHSNGALTLLPPVSLQHPNQSPSVYPSLSHSTSPSLSTVSSPLFFLSTSPSLILLWPESQGRWSIQADAPHPVSRKGKNKGWIQSKQNLLEGARETNREVHGTINPGSDRAPDFYRQAERKHTGGRKTNLPATRTSFWVPS